MSAPTDRFPDGSFPEGYFPVADPISEGDLTIYALQPRNNDVPHEFVLRVYRDETMLAQARPAMTYSNQWGLDVGDLAVLENATEELIASTKG